MCAKVSELKAKYKEEEDKLGKLDADMEADEDEDPRDVEARENAKDLEEFKRNL